MNALARWVPRLVIATALAHFAWGLAQPHAWGAIARDGFLRSVVDPGAEDHYLREFSVWWMVAGVALLAMGTLARHILRTTGRLPAQLGWYLLVVGVPLCLIYFPVTGGWAVLAIGILALVAARRTAATPPALPTPSATGRPPVLPPARWAVWAAWAAPLGVLPSSVWRVAVGFADGHAPSEIVYMTALSCVTVGTAFLTVGLVRHWGETFPRWVPRAAGRPVPARAVTRIARIGALLVILITLYGVLNNIFGFVERAPVLIAQDREYEQPEAWVNYLYLPAAAWGFLVLAVAGDYARRTAGRERRPAAEGRFTGT
ncbi:DUF6463 family protein [Streptomyces bambusae]|uniref:DUF3995 domain-containing protein n=1 Tax=Streptomyces bambusae TaxID=1550616 RepID=A0ABS6Z432_9ACTN|nr:DUF6463 family protein [Streptomyces bambusae]MBW5482487.1 hypothetical protein [Streptomyces bambusae]